MQADEQREDREEYKIVKLFPYEVGKFWAFLKQSLIENPPEGAPLTEGVFTHILFTLLKGYSSVFMIVDKESTPVGYAITLINRDFMSGVDNLYIWHFSKISPLSFPAIRALHKGLSKYAKGMGCHSIRAVTHEPVLKKLYSLFGADVSGTIINVSLEE